MLLSFLALAAFAQAAPNLISPLMAQMPPVARVNTEFIFNLSPSTFNSTSNITYTTSTLPAWLDFDIPTLTFYGTPAAGDIKQQVITLNAVDGTGSTSSNFTLIVTNYSMPAVHSSFSTQIANPPLRVFSSASVLPGNTGVSVPPFWSFSLGWAYDTFRVSHTDPINGELFFSAHQRGATGLPSWISFSNDSFTFEGVAPAEGTYTIVVTGTDFWGYTGALTSFLLEIGTGEAVELARGHNLTNIETMATNKVDYKVDLSGILVGGSPAETADLALSLDNSDYPWLTLNPSNNTITGTTPDEFINGSVGAATSLFVPLTIASTNTSNTLALTTFIGVDITRDYFSAVSLPNSTVKPGDQFIFDVNPYLVNKGVTVAATVSPTDAAKWLTFESSNLTLVGTVPANPKYNEVDVVFSATQNALTATSTLKVLISGALSSGVPTGIATVPTSTTATESHHGGLSKGAKIALGVVFGLLGLVLLLLLLLLCCCRRRKNKEKNGKDDDGDSFVAGSPVPQDPFRRSNGLHQQNNLLGEIARFSGFHLNSGPVDEKRHSVGTYATTAVNSDKPTRMDGLKGIFGWTGHVEEKPAPDNTPRLANNSSSFLGDGDIIGVGDVIDRPSQDASSFTQTFGSSQSSRASWESHPSFRWSSAENEQMSPDHRASVAPSIPRPRPDFTPRYPRNNSPNTLARLASGRTLDHSPDFSEFDSHDEHDSHPSDSFGSDFPSGPSGLNRFGDSGIRSIDEEDEDATSVEGPAIVSMAERQSFETRKPQATEPRPVPRLRPSKERIRSPQHNPPSQRSRNGLAGAEEDGMFDDAEEARRSRAYAPSNGDSEVNGLGPASAIFFGTPNPDGSDHDSPQPSPNRASTIRAIPHLESPLSPPLPQVGSFIRHRHTRSQSRPISGSVMGDGRVVACANETFSMHPTINPPPTVSLSAATWSSAPPSSYRAEVDGGRAIPSWLHFDNKELELWGVPKVADAGSVFTLRIIEKMPNGNRRSDPMSFGYEPPQEREVGRVTIEVVDRSKSPNSPHAL